MSALTQEIVKHILTKLGVSNDNLHNAYNSIMNDSFLMERQLVLINEDNEEVSNQMWSCKISVEEKDFRLLLADCSTMGEQEYALIVALEGSPEYGVYYSITDPSACYIGCLLNGFWVTSTIYMQASFLTGMEQIKDLSSPWVRNDRTDDLFEKLAKFVSHHEEAAV